MKKVFIALIFLCAVGAGVLWFLMKSTPPAAPSFENVKTEAQAEKKDEPSSEKANSEAKTEAEVKSEAPAAGPQLSITTEPVKAEVFIGEESKGQTPLVLPLKDEAQELRFEAEGFEPFVKSAPSKKDAGTESELTWKIALRAKKGALSSSPRATPGRKSSLSSEAPVAKAAPTSSDHLTGSQGPFFVQIESMPFENSEQESAAEAKLAEVQKKLGRAHVKGCVVELSSKGKWLRILSGPFPKAHTKKELKKAKAKGFKGSYVAGAQQCH